MAPSLPRILDVKEDRLIPFSLFEPRNVKPPQVHLQGLFPTKSSRLLTAKPYHFPSNCFRSPLKKQTLRIPFHPQRVRRADRRRIEKGVLPTLLTSKSGHAQVLLSSCKPRKIQKRERVSVNVETPGAFCMFSSKEERIELAVCNKSFLQKINNTSLLPQHLDRRVLVRSQRPESLSRLQKLGYSGIIPSPRKEECLRDFLTIRWFPDDEKKQAMIEKQASEYKPRMTFTR